MVDLPLPVCPIRAILCHLLIVKSIVESTSRLLDGYENETFLNCIDSFIFMSFLIQVSFSFSIENKASTFS